ncbi:MAG: LytTR family DNA-binding domain-containing protein, partial [Lacrimispora sp.]
KLEKQLQNTNLLRIHRSYIVNLLHITAFCLHRVVLKSGEEIPVGSTYGNDVKQAFLNLYGKTEN